jgi:hypothetical protein
MHLQENIRQKYILWWLYWYWFDILQCLYLCLYDWSNFLNFCWLITKCIHLIILKNGERTMQIPFGPRPFLFFVHREASKVDGPILGISDAQAMSRSPLASPKQTTNGQISEKNRACWLAAAARPTPAAWPWRTLAGLLELVESGDPLRVTRQRPTLNAPFRSSEDGSGR